MKNSSGAEVNTDRSSMQNVLKTIQTCFNVLNHIIVSLVAVYMTFCAIMPGFNQSAGMLGCVHLV